MGGAKRTEGGRTRACREGRQAQGKAAAGQPKIETEPVIGIQVARYSGTHVPRYPLPPTYQRHPYSSIEAAPVPAAVSGWIAEWRAVEASGGPATFLVDCCSWGVWRDAPPPGPPTPTSSPARPIRAGAEQLNSRQNTTSHQRSLTTPTASQHPRKRGRAAEGVTPYNWPDPLLCPPLKGLGGQS